MADYRRKITADAGDSQGRENRPAPRLSAARAAWAEVDRAVPVAGQPRGDADLLRYRNLQPDQPTMR
jgi:hypothetical protein